MENIRKINYYEIVKRDWKKVFIITLIFVLIALLITLIQPFKYRADASILVLQKSSFSIDAYSAAKSEERTANKLAQVVYYGSFLDKVLASGYPIEREYFPQEERERRELWVDTINAYVPGGLSTLVVEIYHPDPNQAVQIAQAVAYTLTTEKDDYLAISDIDLKILDEPLASQYPAKPNILLNLFLGLVGGFIVGASFVVITYNPKRDKLFQHK